MISADMVASKTSIVCPAADQFSMSVSDVAGQSPPPLLAGTPKPGFGRKLFPKAHFEPTGLVFPEEGKKNPERGFTGGGYPLWFYGDGKKFGAAEGFKALKLQRCRKEERKNCQGG